MTIELFRNSGKQTVENVTFIKYISNIAYYNTTTEDNLSASAVNNGIRVLTNGTPRALKLYAIEEEFGEYQVVEDVIDLYFANTTGYVNTSAGVRTYAGVGNGFEMQTT